MNQHLHLVTLGVRDLKTSVEFYTKTLGWKPSGAGNEDAAVNRAYKSMMPDYKNTFSESEMDDILAYLARNAGCVVTSKLLMEQVWGPRYTDDTQTLRVHVGHLRKKIEPCPSVPCYIMTEPGVGYRFNAD